MRKRKTLKTKYYSYNFFFVFLICFTILWLMAACFGEPVETGGGSIWTILCVVFVLSLGIVLYIFFNKQVVDIKIDNTQLLFITNSGKIIKIANEDVCEIKLLPSRYVFVIKGRKPLSAYRYMSQKPFSHEKELVRKIDLLIQEGAFPNVRK